MQDFFYEIIQFDNQIVSWLNFIVSGAKSTLSAVTDYAIPLIDNLSLLPDSVYFLVLFSVSVGLFDFVRGR